MQIVEFWQRSTVDIVSISQFFQSQLNKGIFIEFVLSSSKSLNRSTPLILCLSHYSKAFKSLEKPSQGIIGKPRPDGLL